MQRMAGRNDPAGAKRGRDRRRQRLGEGQHLGPGLRRRGALAGDDDDASGGP